VVQVLALVTHQLTQNGNTVSDTVDKQLSARDEVIAETRLDRLQNIITACISVVTNIPRLSANLNRDVVVHAKLCQQPRGDPR